MVDEHRTGLGKVLAVLAAPIILLVMVPLAIIAALGFYLLAVGHGFWLLCRAVPGWLYALSHKAAAPRKPHFLETHTRTGLPD